MRAAPFFQSLIFERLIMPVKLKQNPRFVLSISIPWTLAEHLTQTAEQHGITVSKLARQSIETGLPVILAGGGDQPKAAPQ